MESDHGPIPHDDRELQPGDLDHPAGRRSAEVDGESIDMPRRRAGRSADQILFSEVVMINGVPTRIYLSPMGEFKGTTELSPLRDRVRRIMRTTREDGLSVAADQLEAESQGD